MFSKTIAESGSFSKVVGVDINENNVTECDFEITVQAKEERTEKNSSELKATQLA